MAWKRRSTSRSIDTEVELSDFDPEQLLQALINYGLLTEDEAAAVAARGDRCSLLDEIAPTELEVARMDLRVGRRTDALIHLERALGNEFIGRLT